jgi:uncharacterized membrane protein YjjB (DUF3815 family)
MIPPMWELQSDSNIDLQFIYIYVYFFLICFSVCFNSMTGALNICYFISVMIYLCETLKLQTFCSQDSSLY